MERSGAWYHVTAWGHEGRPIHRDIRDQQHFCALLTETVGTFSLVSHPKARGAESQSLLINRLQRNVRGEESRMASAIGIGYGWAP